MSEQEQAEKALELIKEVYEDQCAEINGREYRFTKTTHKTRRKVFAFLSSVQHRIAAGDFGFMEDRPDYDQVERLMFGMITFEGMQLTKCEGHWEEYPEDYLKLIPVALQVITYPFMRASDGA